jgi:hypothetical protein
MEYVEALLPSTVLAIAFCAVVITILRNQGGSNKAKEDAAADAAFAKTSQGAAQVELPRQDSAR